MKLLKNVNNGSINLSNINNHNSNDQIYKIYGVAINKNSSSIVKNKIDRSNLRYNVYKPKKYISDNHIQKISQIPRKLSPLALIKK